MKYGEVTQLKQIKSGVFHGNVLHGSLLYIADLPVALGSTIAIYADDTAILAHNNQEASLRLNSLLHSEVAKKVKNQS